MKNCKSYLLPALLCSLAAVQVCAQAPEVVLVGKTDNYVQTSTAAPTIDINFVGPPEYGQRYQFTVTVNAGADLSGIPAPTVTLAAGSTAPAVIGAGHNGGVLVWNANEDRWSYGSGGFNWATNDAASRDALFAEGVYTVNVLGTSVNLNLATTAFAPNTPQVTLTGGIWAGGKYYINVSQALTITTNEFTNYDQNANGAISLGLWEQNGLDLLDETVVHSATPLGLPVDPSSKSLTRTIAPGTLVAGRTYTGDVTFSTVVDQVAGAQGSVLANSLNVAIRERTTRLTIVAYTGKVPFVSLYGMGDLPGGNTVSSARDATKVDGVIYAVGGSNEKGGNGVTSATLWTSAAGLVALPDLAANTSTSGIEALAITRDGAYIASRAHASSVATDRRAVRVTTNGLVNLDLGGLVPVPASSGVSAISDDGSVLYGGAPFVVGGKNQMVRYTASGPTATAIPFLSVGDDTNNLPIRGASSDGTVAVGTSTSSTAAVVGTGLGNKAFRYLHGTGVSAIPFLAGGTWNAALAVTPDGNLVLVRGNSTAFPNGEIYLYNAATTSITPLGSPNATLVPGGNARMTVGGSAVICGFGPTTYVRNSTGWHLFTAILAGTGVDLTGWNITAFQGMSSDGTLICGVAGHNTFTEGYVLELPAGYLADAAPVITSPLTAGGTYGQLFDYILTAANQPDDFDALNLPATLSVNHTTGYISGLLAQAGVFPVTISASNYFGTDIKELLLTVAPAPASIQLDNLFQTYDGFPKFVTATTTPVGQATAITYDGSATIPTNAGSYAVIAAMADPNYTGSASGILTVAQATATVTVTATSQTYDGAPKPVTVSTTPSGLNTIVTYNGTTTVPTSAGNYGVNATVNEVNYAGSASTTLTVTKGTATISLGNLVQPYDGNPHAVSVTTNPAGVAVNVLYDGSPTLPLGVGSYPVSVALNDANYNNAGASGTLTITDNSVAPTQASLYGIGDLAGGNFNSQVRDAVRVNGVLFAVGFGSVNGNGDKGVLWSTAGGLTQLPNIAGITTGTTPIIASAITPGARYIATRARFNPGAPNQRHAVRLTVSGLANLDLGGLPGLSGNSAANAISDDGAIVYGFDNNLSQAARYTVSGGPAGTLIPFLNAGDNASSPAGRGASADGAVMVGTSTNTAVDGGDSFGPGNAAFRYVHGTGVVAIPYLSGGTWNSALAVSPDGNLTLVRGNSASAPQGEVYLHNAATGSTASLGTPNGSRGPTNFGGMSADGAVVAITFNALDNPFGASYIRNSHGWHDLQKVVAAAGVDPTGWDFSNILGMSHDGTLVWGSGLHNGNNEGFVVEFPVGYLADYTEPAVYSTPAPAIVGAWTVGDTATIDSAVLIFFSNGYYMHIERGDDSSSADGFERGQYTWDAATGAFTCTTLLDTTGDSGLGSLNGVAGVTLTVSGDTLTASIPGEPDPVVLSRVVGSSPIVGAWGDAAIADQSAALVFLPNGYYFMAQDGDSTLAGDPNGHDGMEWGTYSWDSATGVLTASTLADSNGEWGLSHPQGAIILSVSGYLRTLSGNAGAFALPRVGPASPAITLDGLAQTYDGTPRSATVTTIPGGIATVVTYDGNAALPVNAGSYSVVATIADPLYTGSVSGTLNIAPATALVNFADTTHVYDGSVKSVTVSTDPAGLTTNVTYGSGSAPSSAGQYTVDATVVDANYIGSGTTTLTIEKAAATVILGNLSQIYDGAPKPATVTTTPANLTVNVTYNGSATVPTAVGSYAVAATINDTNYQGAATGTLVIGLAPLQIVTQPVSATVIAGQTASFTVVATGTGPISYQWRLGTTDIVGATSATLSIPNAQAVNAGNYRVVVSNGINTPITSAVASLTVLVPPVITTQPLDLTRNVGQNASFSVTATGTATLLYQWRKDGANIAGATTRTLSLTNVTSASGGLYSVVVSNATGAAYAVASAEGRLTVIVAPTITTQPEPVTAIVGAPATFTVVATGTAPLTYQWRKGTTDILGATGSSYTIPSAQTTDAANYRVAVTNAANSVVSIAVSLTVLVPPAITVQPVDVTKNAGQNASFSVTATGTATLLYQWRKDGVDIAGAISRTLSLAGVTSANEGLYSVVVSNATGQAYAVTSVGARLSVLVKPTIITQPVSMTVSAGGSATFTVVATGTGPLSYQWKKGNTNLPNANNATYTIPVVQASDAGNYKVVVSNVVSPVTSAVASLVVQ